MGRRSSRVEEVKERNELSCMWGLFSILESCQGRPGHREIVDYLRPLDTIASFDEECRKIHIGEGMRRRGVGVDGRARSARNCIGDDVPVEKHESKRGVVKRRQYATKTDGELVDRLMRSRARTRKSSRDVIQSSSSRCLSNATSAEKSLDKLTLAAILGAVCAQNHHQEIKLSEYLQRNSFDEINIRMRAKALVDQMYIDRRFVLGEGRSSESKSFSDALEMLNSRRGVLMDLLPDPDSLLARRSKKTNHPQTGEDTIKSLLSGNGSEHKAKTDDESLQNIDCQHEYSPPSDKIVILKPAPRNGKHSGNLGCSCSSLQFPYKSNRRASEEKTAAFSLRRIKKKLRHTFGVSKREESQLCICDSNSSTAAGKEGKASKKQELKSTRGSDIARVTDDTRRKLYLSSAGSSDKQERDVILEAKRHLSTRLNNLNTVEAVTSKSSPRTLERILASPEHDFWPFSPRRDSLYCSGSAEMRFSPYSSSHVRNELRSSAEVASLQEVDGKAYSVIPRIEPEAEVANISTADKMQIDGEVVSETNSTRFTKSSETNATVEAQKRDAIETHSAPDSPAEIDFPSTPSNRHHTDRVESIKFQEEHQSPVSVLEPFFVEDSNSPPTITLQTGQFSAREQLQPHRLDFEECSLDSSPQCAPASVQSCLNEELCQYVQLVTEASSLDWDQLSELRCQPEEELLHDSLYDEVELPPLDCYYDPKLLFDHINEVLVEIYKCHFSSPPWLASATPQISSSPLAEVVLDEILAEADYFLLPTSERRSLNELVSEDARRASWLDLGHDTEHIVIAVSEAILEESLLDTLVEFHT